VIISGYQKNMSHIELKVEFVKKRIEYLMTEVERTSNVPLTKCVKK
jgi:archaellum component FlaC